MRNDYIKETMPQRCRCLMLAVQYNVIGCLCAPRLIQTIAYNITFNIEKLRKHEKI